MDSSDCLIGLSFLTLSNKLEKGLEKEDSLAASSRNEVSLYFCFLMGYHPVSATPPSHRPRAHILILYCSSKWRLLLMASWSSWIIHSSRSLYHPKHKTPCCTKYCCTKYYPPEKADFSIWWEPCIPHQIWSTDKITHSQGTARQYFFHSPNVRLRPDLTCTV